jgi:hypothetical protein
MQQLPFRLARGVAVLLAIVSAHFVIVWLFDTMRVRVPDLGPVFPMFFDDPRAAPQTQPPAGNDAKPASAPASEVSDVAIRPPGETGPAEARQHDGSPR